MEQRSPRPAAGGPAARSEGTGASGDDGVGGERQLVAGHDDPPKAGHDDPRKLDDSRIVAITRAANQAEIEQGKLARERATDPRVRDFAAMMIDHHGEAQNKQEQLKVEPQPGADVLNEQREAKQRLADLREKKGAEFDRAYLELQIEEHRRLLDKLNRELVPAAKDESVASYLEEIRPRVESHLAQAERLQQELSSGSKSLSRTTISNKKGSSAKVKEPR